MADREARAQRLVARSAAPGSFAIDRPEDLPGRFFHEGEIMAYVLPEFADVVRTTVSQDDIDLVRHHLRSTSVKLVDSLDHTYAAELEREVPAGRDELPSKALGSAGGGAAATDPRDKSGKKTLQRQFQFDLRLDEAVPADAFGSRVYVRFEHGWEPLAVQWYRRLRQLVMSRLDG